MINKVDSISIRNDIICLRVTNRFTGQSKSMTKDEVNLVPVGLDQAVPDENRTRATKRLFDADQITELYRVQQRLRQWLSKRTVPSSLGDSIYAVRRDRVGFIQAHIEEALVELESAKLEVKENYSEIVTSQSDGLGDLYNAEDYPLVDDFLDTFGIESRWIQIGTPPELEEVNSELFKAELNKQQNDIDNAAKDYRQLVRTEFNEIMQSFRGMISGDKKQQFNSKVAKKLNEFRDNFNFRDLTDDLDLKHVLDEMHDVVSGIDAKSIRTDDELRDAFRAATQAVIAEADKLVETKPKRRILLKGKKAE